MKKCVLRKGVHLKKEILYDLYILGTEWSVHLEGGYIVCAFIEERVIPDIYKK